MILSVHLLVTIKKLKVHYVFVTHIPNDQYRCSCYLHTKPHSYAPQTTIM